MKMRERWKVGARRVWKRSSVAAIALLRDHCPRHPCLRHGPQSTGVPSPVSGFAYLISAWISVSWCCDNHPFLYLLEPGESIQVSSLEWFLENNSIHHHEWFWMFNNLYVHSYHILYNIYDFCAIIITAPFGQLAKEKVGSSRFRF
jgi:hypothetical protein